MNEDEFFHLTVPYEPEFGREYYLLYVEYSTGDSFGRDDGRLEFIGLYDDVEIAKENARRIRESADKSFEAGGGAGAGLTSLLVRFLSPRT